MNKDHAIYGVFWIWGIVVTGVTIVLLVTLNYSIEISLGQAISVEGISFKLNKIMSDYFVPATKIVLSLLVWWRIFKAFVLQGSPFTFGMHVSMGREHKGVTGRPVVLPHIGTITGGQGGRNCLFGAVFRAHQTSDKIMRARLEFLLIAFPFNITVLFNEGRPSISRKDPEARAERYIREFFSYMRAQETIPDDRFKQETVKHLKTLADKVRKTSPKRIDGLNWSFNSFDGSCDITDDFGYSINYTRNDDGKFNVTGLGEDGAESRVVDAIENVRELAQTELTPT